ncbi:MAG: PAS domain S-box protein [Conexivisphaerales archaeon]
MELSERSERNTVLSKELQSLMNRINSAFLLLDKELKLVYASNFSLRVLGLENTDYEKIDFLSLLPERDRPRALEVLQRALKGESINSVLLSTRTRKGAERLVSWQIEPINLEEIALILVGQDITENETLERELMAANDKLASVLDNSTFTILTIDLDLRIDYVNRRGVLATGYTREELLGKHIGEIFIGLNAGELGGFMSTIYRGATFGPAEARLRTKDGTLISYEITVDPVFVQGTVVGAVITASDITQRKRQEERIRFQAAMLDQVESAVMAESLEGEVTYWNMASEKLFGWKVSEVMGRDLLGIIRPEPLAGTSLPPINSLKTLGSWNGDIQLERRDGTKFPARVSVSLITGRDERPMAIAFVVVDLTERLHLEDQLREFNEQLSRLVEQRTRQLQISQEKLVKAERLAAIGELAAQVGHDLRNPLTSINTAIYLLDSMLSDNSGEEVRLAIKTMKKSIEHANRIIEELLEYSRGTIAETRVERMKGLVQAAIERLKIPKNVEILNNIPEDVIADVDGSRMQRVFENLIKNSIDAMPKGGRILLEGGSDENKVWIEVKDNGTGIKKSELANMFKPLFTTKPQGMGLGLPICKRIVEAHGGSISLDSTWGVGTTVRVELPAVKPGKARKELLDVGLSSQG